MNVIELINRLRQASASKSLRQLGRDCDVSHELIRKLIVGGKSDLTVVCYNKIDQGLKRNGI